MPALLEVRGLWKRFGEVVAVAGINLTVNAGEVHGLIGPNGAGKTTTVKCVVGLLKPDSGEILVYGKNILDGPGYKAVIGYLPENPALPEYLRPKEFLGYVGRLHGLTGTALEERIRELSARVRIEDLESFIVNLSRGMRQKLAVVAALLHRPKLILMDEPFVGIDPEGQRAVKELIWETVEEGGAALISTHMLELAERFCTHATVIDRGRNLAAGPLDELKRMVGLDPSAPLERVYESVVARRWEKSGQYSPSS